MANLSKLERGDGTGSPVLILGIDPGTTSFKVAFLTAEEVCEDQETPHLVQSPTEYVDVLANFPGYHQQDLTNISTSLIYNKKGQLIKWGHEATNFQTQLGFDPDLIVNHWKLGLHKSSDPTARQIQHNLEAIAERLGKRPESFIEDFFSAIRSYLFEDGRSVLLKHFGGGLDHFKYIDVIIAVPPGWPQHEHRTFSSAATVGLGGLPGLTVYTVSETECVLRSWMLQGRKELIDIGDIVILLDLGGGTACISVFRYEAIEDDRWRWTHLESHSLSTGSEVITQEFVNDFQRRLEGVTCLQKMSMLVHRARKAFERKKMRVGDNSVEANWAVKVTGLKPDPIRDFGQDQMYFRGDRLLSYFDTSLDPMLAKIDEVTTRIARTHGRPKYCIAAGAYARNLLFQKRFKAANRFEMKIFYPQNIAELVARGACQARVDGEFHQFPGIRYSIGIKSYIFSSEAKPLYPEAYERTFKGSSTRYSPAISWTVKTGDTIIPHNEIGDSLTYRYFEPDEDIQFTDTIFFSESHPGSAKYTVLRYSTADSALWSYNERNLRKRGIIVEAAEITWDLGNTRVRQEDGSWGPFKRSALRKDPEDTRAKKRRFLKYKYYLDVSQADCRISIEAFFAGNKSYKMQVGQRPIKAVDIGEIESKALQEEYDNLPQSMGNDENPAADIITRASSHGSQNPASYLERESSWFSDSASELFDTQSPVPNGPASRENFASRRDSLESLEAWSSRGYGLGHSRGKERGRASESPPPTINHVRHSAQHLRNIATAADEFLGNDEPSVAATEGTQHSRYVPLTPGQENLPRKRRQTVSPTVGSSRTPLGVRRIYETRSSTSRTSSPQRNQTRFSVEPPVAQTTIAKPENVLQRKKHQPSLRSPVVTTRRQTRHSTRSWRKPALTADHRLKGS